MRELRARYKMTQKDVADAIGINSATYCAWETLSAKDIEKLAEVFKVSAADIIVAD